jgi:hypothetical protein
MMDETGLGIGFSGGPDLLDAMIEHGRPQFHADPAAAAARRLRAAAERCRSQQAARREKRAEEEARKAGARADRSGDIQADRLALVRARFNHEVALRLTQWAETLEVRRVAASDEDIAYKITRIKKVLFGDDLGGPPEPGPSVAPSAAYRPEALVPAPPSRAGDAEGKSTGMR